MIQTYYDEEEADTTEDLLIPYNDGIPEQQYEEDYQAENEL